MAKTSEAAPPRLSHQRLSGPTGRPLWLLHVRDKEDGRGTYYRLAPKGIELAPALLEILIWGAHHEETDAPSALIEGMERNRAVVIAEAYRRWEQRDRTPLISPFTASLKSESNSAKGRIKR